MHTNNSSTLVFLRHGLSEGNVRNLFQGQRDYPLAPQGVLQAEALAERWRSENRVFDLVITSPLSRASQTAQVVADALGLELHTDPLWMEQDFGTLSDQNIYDYIQSPDRPDYFSPFNQPGETGESPMEVYARATQAVQKLSTYLPANLLVVSHGAFLNMVFYTILGLVPHPNAEGPRFPHQNTGFSTFTYQADRHRWVVHGINDHRHLNGFA
jgi:2,3-bisphosphoglycerate-dependent phosphoglycerate mutase